MAFSHDAKLTSRKIQKQPFKPLIRVQNSSAIIHLPNFFKYPYKKTAPIQQGLELFVQTHQFASLA